MLWVAIACVPTKVGPTDAGPDADANLGFDACVVINGLWYQSFFDMECGVDPMGITIMCPWRVNFDNGQWEWIYSDVTESGSYACIGKVIIGGPYVGALDPATGILTWEGVSYVPSP